MWNKPIPIIVPILVVLAAFIWAPINRSRTQTRLLDEIDQATKGYIQDEEVPEPSEASVEGRLKRPFATMLAAHGDYYLRRGDVDSAISRYFTALLFDSENPAALAGQADAMLLEDEVNGARSKYQSALTYDPNFPPALSGLAIIAQQEGDAEKALELFQRALDPSVEGFDPGVIEAYSRFVDQHTGISGDFVAWLDGYLNDHPEDLRAHVIAGDFYRRNANPDRAIELWAWVYSKRPDYPRLAQRLGEMHAGQGNFVESAKIFDALYAAEPSADTLYSAATAHGNIPDLEGAKTLFQQGVTEYPNDPRFTLGLGQVAYEQGDYQAARDLLLPLAESPGATPEMLRETGLAEIKLGNFDAAESWLLKAEAAKPDDPWINFQRGYLAARRGDKAIFETEFKQVFNAGFMTMAHLETFDNLEALMAIEWAAEWLNRETVVNPGEGHW